jgi:hypothetical protein
MVCNIIIGTATDNYESGLKEAAGKARDKFDDDDATNEINVVSLIK